MAEFRDMVINKLTLGIIKTLEKRTGIQDILLDPKGPAESSLINSWETKNCCTLPSDLKQFYLTSNGFLLTWRVRLKDDIIPVGRMEINQLSRLEKVSAFTADDVGGSIEDVDLTEEEDPAGLYPHFDVRSRIFELDPCMSLGKVCLVYRNTKQGVPAKNSEYWFLDKALRWHFITEDFSSYYRLMITHLGLPQWQYLFTDIGVSPSVKQWYSLYAPTSLDMSYVDQSQENANEKEINVYVDVTKVFKGKDRKKPMAPAANQATNKKKMSSPIPNKNANSRANTSALQKPYGYTANK